MNLDLESKETLDLFVDLSTVLTGYSRERLAPRLDPVDLKTLYWNATLANADREALTAMLVTFATIRRQPRPRWPELTRQQILSHSAQAIVAHQIVKAWYVGIWYPPPAPPAADPCAEPGPSPEVLSLESYTNGLLWDAVQAHPMGFSELHFGYWGEEPPPPGDFFSEEPEGDAS